MKTIDWYKWKSGNKPIETGTYLWFDFANHLYGVMTIGSKHHRLSPYDERYIAEDAFKHDRIMYVWFDGECLPNRLGDNNYLIDWWTPIAFPSEGR